jgi:uncharacterized membrane protein
MATVVPAPPRRPIKALRVVVGILVLIMLGAVVRRMVIDVPNVIAGTLPEATYDVRFVRHHWIAYLHIGPGALYLLGACLQLAYRFRGRHYTFHRRLGRVLVGTALLSGVFAIVIGILFPFGGIVHGAAAVVFGLWFITCLILAVRAIRRDDMFHHRRWMIRAFAVGIAVGTIRIWVGLFLGLGLLDFEDAFAPAFWISFSLHAAAAELWLRRFPNPPELAQPARSLSHNGRKAVDDDFFEDSE